MIAVRKAAESDHTIIVSIGLSAVFEAHKDSTSPENLNAYLRKNYNDQAITEELADPRNNYYIISYNGQPAGFSKIEMNAAHPAIHKKNVTKLDRIYLQNEYQGLKLGWELLQANITLCKNNNQAGIWLYTWIGNKKAIDFYHKAGFTIIGSHKFYVTETYFNLNHHMYLDFATKALRH